MTELRPRITGLDLSLTSTGIATIHGTSVRLDRIQPGRRDGHPRVDWIRAEIWGRIPDTTLAVIEGPSYGSDTGKQHERAGLWWIVTRMLWRAHIPYAVAAPSQVKKYATGTGGGPKSGKDQVLAAAIRRYPSVPVDGNDVADALILAAMGADHLGSPLAPVPQLNRTVLAAIHWPATQPAT